MLSHGGVVAASANGAAVYAPDGSQVWAQAGDVAGVGAGPADEIAIATPFDGVHTQLELREPDGALRWSQTIAALPHIALATDGADVFVSISGFDDPIAGGRAGSLARVAKDGLVWSTAIAGSAPTGPSSRSPMTRS